MFTKLYPKVRIYGNLVLTLPYWITNKKVVSHSNTHLPYDFNTIQLNTPSRLDLHNLNRYKGWK